MTVLVTGSRDWSNRRAIVKRLLEFPDGTTIIQGAASGADRIAAEAAHAIGLKVIFVRADWHIYGRSAGPIRNRKMLDMKPDLVLGFRRNMSKGTTDCLNEAVSRHVPIEVQDE